MTKERKAWLDEADIGNGEKKPGDRETEREIRKPGTSERVKEDEKRKGLVDEDHPFPSKGN